MFNGLQATSHKAITTVIFIQMKLNAASSSLKVLNSDPGDLDFIFQLFDSAIDYQKKHGYELWPQFSKELILAEISGKRHWKITDGDTIACIFSVMYNDPVIWAEKDVEPSVYLHRIAVNPVCKGKGMMSFIKEWAGEHGKQQGKKYLRMDTWGNNESLRNYYISCGFNYIG
jgi:GNAT superfamily N-acetyltransferase